jgi:hypothetical protein
VESGERHRALAGPRGHALDRAMTRGRLGPVSVHGENYPVGGCRSDRAPFVSQTITNRREQP